MTEAAPVSVNTQVFCFLPPLEQLLDQMASRLLLTRRVTEALMGNEADRVAGTRTLMPDGVEAAVERPG